MSTEQKATDQNALASRLGGAWSNFKQGKLISYRLMAILLLLVAGLGLWWYIGAERRKANSQAWMILDDANSDSKLEDIAKNDKNGVTARVARLQLARSQLGPEGIDLLTSIRPELRAKGIENIEKARDAFTALLEQFKDDPAIKAECLYGLASAEMALVAVPMKQEQPVGVGAGPIAPAAEHRGKVAKAIEYLDQLVAAAPDTPWATSFKKLADEMRNDPSKFSETSISLFSFVAPSPKLDDPHSPFGPIPPDFPSKP